MNRLKKSFIRLLTIILTALIAILIVSSTIKEVLIDEIFFQGFKTTITGKSYEEGNKELTLDDIITEDGVITDNDFVNEILESEEIKKLVNNYIDRLIELIGKDEITEEELENLNIEQDMIEYIKENKEVLQEKTGIEITDEMIDTASEKINERDTKKVLKQTLENTRNSLTEEEKDLLKTYQLIVSTKLKVILVIGIIISIVLIIILNEPKYLSLKNISSATIFSSLSTIIISIALNAIVKSLINGITLKTNKMLTLSIIVLVMGIVLYIIYYVLNKKISKRGGKNEISKVSA